MFLRNLSCKITKTWTSILLIFMDTYQTTESNLWYTDVEEYILKLFDGKW